MCLVSFLSYYYRTYRYYCRRLVDMLSENEDVISFYPGSVKKEQVTLGRIVVHDRLKVEADVLPRYFNHSSFASLRRQLNYFSFTRMGKGRQPGAAYCNDGVIRMDDILRLKRRSSVGPSRETTTQHPTTTKVTTGKRERSVSLSSSASVDRNEAIVEHATSTAPKQHRAKKSRPTIVSPSASPVHHIEEEEPQVVLDLTVPSQPSSAPRFYAAPHQGGEPDVLAGCRALLSFSRGLPLGGEIGSAI
jgi:hypothetical protein